MNNSMRLRVCVAAIVASSATHAEENGIDSAGTLEEVTVTAERRAQSLQDLPTTASALTNVNLASQQIQRIDDLVRATPALTINDTGLGKFVNIRGIGKGADVPGVSPGVAYYVDGVPIPNQIFLETPFFDLGRVEVLRGPQGTLVGMNSTGGALLILSQNPEYDKYSGSLEQSGGNFGYRRTRGVVNLGFGDSWGIRASGEYEQRDSFFTNLGPADGNPGDVDRLSLRATLAGAPTDAIEIFLRGEFNRNDTDGVPAKPIPGDPDPLYNVINAFSPADSFALTRDVATSKDTEYQRISAEARFELANFLELRSITGYQKGEIEYLFDLDATALPTVRQNIEIDEPVFSQEINLISTAGGSLDWVAGAFYLHQDTNGHILLANAITGAPQVEVIGRGRTRNYGLFAQATYHATEALNVTLGLRHNEEEHYSGDDGRTILGGVVVLPNATNVAKDGAPTGRLTLDYHLSPVQLLYATVSRGFKGGGNNDAGTTYESETVWNYEIGVKSTFLDEHVRTQFGVFYNDYENLQSEVFNPITTLSAVDNFATAEVYGAELQMQAQFGGLGFNTAIAYTGSKLEESALVDPRYGSATPVNLAGRSLNFSPEWTLSGGLQYAIPVGTSFALTPRVQYSYLDRQWASVFQVQPTDLIESRSIVDASIVLGQEDGGWQLEAYGSNLTDETYVASKSVAAAGRPGRVQYYGNPRQYGLRVGYSF